MTNVIADLSAKLTALFTIALLLLAPTAFATGPSTFDKIQSGSHLLARQAGGKTALTFSETELTFREADLNPSGYRACNLYLSGGIAVDGFLVSIERLTPDELAPLQRQNSGQNSRQNSLLMPTHRLTMNNVNPGALKLSGLGSSIVYLILKKDDSGGETLRGRGLFLLQNHDVHVYTPTPGTLFVKGLENAAAQSVQQTAQLTPATAYYYLVCNLGIQ
ncbi:hypothetical protein BH10BDE1_BH10BDE1_33720 [soil metagenome]